MKTVGLFLGCIWPFAMLAQSQTMRPADANVYVYNGGKDTLYLKKLDLGRIQLPPGSVTLVKEIQIDGVGAKELVLFRRGVGHTSDHGGSFDIDETKNIGKYEIWNPDTKTLLFEAVSLWSYDYNIFRASMTPNDRRKGSEKYSYDFIVTDSGEIIIDNFCGSKDVKPDHNIGTYRFVNGKYTSTQ